MLYNLPMNKNDEITLEITGCTSEGQGVGRYGGMAVFVPRAAVGDVCAVHIVKVAKTYAVGKLVSVISPSKDRVAPACPHFERCGGCAFMHINYAAELRIKKETVENALSRIGKLSVRVDDVVGAESVFQYRNKACFPIRLVDGKVRFCFFSAHSHRPVALDGCAIQNPLACEIAGAVCDFMNENGVLPYDEQTGAGLVRHIFVRTSESGHAHLCIVVNGRKLPHAQALVNALNSRFPTLTGITLSENTRRDNVILGDTVTPLWGAPALCDTLCGAEFEISPLSFYQVNHAQCEKLYEIAANAAALQKDDTVFDLYCGIGTMSLLFARRAGAVYGVDVVESAIENARRAAEKAGLENVRFVCGDAPKTARELIKSGVTPTVVVVDPPRAGLDAALISDIVALSPKRVVYVSCNPATLARDLALFAQGGYTAASATPVDMFPRTPHCEVVCKLLRSDINP